MLASSIDLMKREGSSTGGVPYWTCDDLMSIINLVLYAGQCENLTSLGFPWQVAL